MRVTPSIKIKVPSMLKITIVLIVVAAIVLFVMNSFIEVPNGHVAVVVDPLRGTISTPIVGPALIFRWPWQSIVVDELTYQTINMLSAGEGVEGELLKPVEALTKDGSILTVDITVVFRIVPENFNKLVQVFPALDYDDRIIIPTVRQIVRDIVAKYTLMEAIEKRDTLSKEITEAVYSRLLADPTLQGLIKIEQVAVRRIMPPQTIIQKINEKLAAQQEALKAQYEKQAIVTRAQAEAERKIIEANATATQEIIRARAEATKRVLEANATREAFMLIGRGQGEAILLIANVSGLPVDEAAKLYAYLKYLETLQQVLANKQFTVIYIGGQGGNGTPTVLPIIPLPLDKYVLPTNNTIAVNESG